MPRLSWLALLAVLSCDSAPAEPTASVDPPAPAPAVEPPPPAPAVEPPPPAPTGGEAAADETPLHHCDTIEEDSECTEFTAAGIEVLPASTREGICRDLGGGTFGAGPCPTEGRVGRCRIAGPPNAQGQRPVGQIVGYYSRGGSAYTFESARERACIAGTFVED